MTMSINDLMAQRAELERKISAMQFANRAATIEKIHALMAEAGVTHADLTGHQPAEKLARRASETGADSRAKSAAVYRDQKSDQTWSGRSLQPKWLE